MSNIDIYIEILKEQGLLREYEDDEDKIRYIIYQFLDQGRFINEHLDLYRKEKSKPKTIDTRLSIVEDELNELKRNFKRYLKTEFKEESNRVFINILNEIIEVKLVYVKYFGDIIRYYIIYKTDNYVDFLDIIIDKEIKLEESYPMLRFEFIHKDIKDFEKLNLKGTYLIHSKEG